MYFKYIFENVFQIQNTNMYFKYVFQILVFEILPSTGYWYIVLYDIGDFNVGRVPCKVGIILGWGIFVAVRGSPCTLGKHACAESCRSTQHSLV